MKIRDQWLAMGIREGQPTFLQAKLRTANVVFQVIFVAAIGYSAMIFIRYPEADIAARVGLSLTFATLILGMCGFHVAYRLLMSFCAVVGGGLFHAALMNTTNFPIASSITMQLVFSLMPLIIFDLREKQYLLPILIANLLLLVNFRFLANRLDVAVTDASPYVTGPMQEITITFSFGLAIAAIWVMARHHRQAEDKAELILDESNRRNQEIIKKQETLEASLRQVEEAQETERQRHWAATGHAEISNKVRTLSSDDETWDQIIAYIVTYLEANQGGLFIVEGDAEDRRLDLKACYAYQRKKFVQATVQPGEGLVGQCYLERAPVHLTEIPPGYTRITSGLGQATPHTVLIIPLMTREQVEGVLELASFRTFTDYQIEFLLSLGETIATAVTAHRAQRLTHELLAQAQQQAEDVRAQEEEMRQNMEELQATQEEMARKQAEAQQREQALTEKLAQYER